MLSFDLDLLSPRASVIWIAALAAVLVFHCGHWIQKGGQHRWLHSAHIVMLLGMLYMYASMAFGWRWFPPRLWTLVYVASTAAIMSWMLARFAQRRAPSYLWSLALVQQGAMIYMSAPMADWAPWASYALAAYFTVESIAWLTGLYAYDHPAHGRAAGTAASLAALPLGRRSTLGALCSTVMAASMGYMFIGMQLMMTMPEQPAPLPQGQAPPRGVSNPGRYEPKSAPDREGRRIVPTQSASA